MRRLRLEVVISVYILLAVINSNCGKLTLKWGDKVTPSIGSSIINNKNNLFICSHNGIDND